MDAATYRVPIEEANRYFRLRQKAVERVFGAVMSSVEALPDDTDAHAHTHTEETAKSLDAAIAMLTDLERSVSAWSSKEVAALERLQARHRQLKSGEAQAGADVYVYVCEHLYRRGAAAAGDAVMEVLTPEQRVFVDRDVATEIQEAAHALLSRRDLAPALRWVHDNASRLRRQNSSLEFALRRQEFVELVRAKNLAAALEHATAHLAPAATAATQGGDTAAAAAPADGAADGRGGACVRQLQQAMSLLAFPDPPHCGIPELEILFTPAAWEELAELFVEEAESAMGWRPHTRLEAACAAGLTALRTPSCKADYGTALDGTTAGLRGCDGRRVRAAVPAAIDALLHASAPASQPSAAGTAMPSACAPLLHAGAAVASAEAAVLPGAVPATRTVVLPSSNAHACPVCHPLYFAEAQHHVPTCRRGVSRLLCAVTHEPMNEDNPPVVLPNGRVFASKTLELLRSDDGRSVIDPSTGDVFPQADVRKAFVL